MPRTVFDIAALIARICVGGIFIGNGWQKLEAGLNATSRQFDMLGAPAPALWAGTTLLFELAGGALLVAGLAVQVMGLLLFAEAACVFALSGGATDLPLAGGSGELLLALGAAAILLAAHGGGRISADHLVFGRREADRAAEAEADEVLAGLRDERGVSASNGPLSEPDESTPLRTPGA